MTDLPITEWEGVERTERKGRSTDYLYHFKFMAMNNLTGTLTIENCSENIVLYNCDYANNKLEGLHLKNCPNLYFDNKIYQNGEDITPYSWMERFLEYGTCYVGIISNHLKSIYFDNVQSTIVDRDEEKYYKTKVISSFFDEFQNKWENLEIRNCNDLYDIELSNCSSLKKFICENNRFLFDHDNFMFGNSSLPDIFIYNCPSLNEVTFRKNSTQFTEGINYIFESNNLNEVIIEGLEGDLDTYHIFEAYNSQINKLSIKDGIHSLQNLKRFNNESEQLLTIRNIHVTARERTFLYISSDFNLNQIGIENLLVEGFCDINASLDFSNNPTIKTIEFNPVDEYGGTPPFISWSDIILNGCINLESFNYYACVYKGGNPDFVPILDVRNTPKLKELTCRGDLRRIEFDSHMNDVKIDCLRLNIVQEIPDCYTGEGSGWFSYDHLYEYIYNKKGEYVTHKKNDCGWYYPGEPDSRQHSR